MAVDRPEALERPEGSPDQLPRVDGRDSAGERECVDRRGASGTSDDLGKRLDSLPDGHPSSRREADGSRRESPVDLRSLDTGPEDTSTEADARETPYFTDAGWTDHVADVRTSLDKAHLAGQATDHRYTIDPDRSRWTRDRRHQQNEIIEDLYEQAANVPNEGQAILAGGLPGAGKTTVLGKHADIDRSKYLTINPDDVKSEMAKRGMIPEVDGLSPMEASDLIHEESSYVARRLAMRAQSDGKNVIWDITMSSPESTERRIDDLHAAGYTSISGIFVDIPIGVSAARTDSRHREDEEKFRKSDGLGGRYVPPDVVSAQADPDWGCCNRRTFEDLKSRFDQWTLFDNGVDYRDPIRVEGSHEETES